MLGAECWTDRRLTRVELNIRTVPQHRKHPKTIRLTFNTARLLSAKYQQEFQSNLDDKFEVIEPLTGGPEEKWNQFKKAVTETAKTVLGLMEKLHECWFDDNDGTVRVLLDDKRKAYTDWQNHPYCSLQRDRYRDCQTRVQRELCSMQGRWWEQKAEEVQLCADTSNSTMLYSTTKATFGQSRSGTVPLTTADGSTIMKG